MIDAWATWNVCGSKICGVPSNSQCIESEHRVIKAVKMDCIRAPMTYLLHVGFPNLLRRARQMDQVDVPITNYCDPDKIPRASLFAAKMYLEVPPAPRQKLLNYKVSKSTVDDNTGIELKSMIINSSHHSIQLKNKAGELSQSRITCYQNSLVAKSDFKFPVVPPGKSKFEAAADICTSLYGAKFPPYPIYVPYVP